MITAIIQRLGTAAMGFVAAALFAPTSAQAGDAAKAAPTPPVKATRAKAEVLKEVTLRVKVIHARRSGKFIDTRIRHIEKMLKPLFNFSSYRLVKEEKLQLLAGAEVKVPLPFRGNVVVRQRGRVENKIRLALQVGRRNKMRLLLENGGTFLHGITLKNGQSYILAFTATTP